MSRPSRQASTGSFVMIDEDIISLLSDDDMVETNVETETGESSAEDEDESHLSEVTTRARAATKKRSRRRYEDEEEFVVDYGDDVNPEEVEADDLDADDLEIVRAGRSMLAQETADENGLLANQLAEIDKFERSLEQQMRARGFEYSAPHRKQQLLEKIKKQKAQEDFLASFSTQDDSETDPSHWRKMLLPELRDVARSRGVNSQGKKADLVARLVNHAKKHNGKPQNPVSARRVQRYLDASAEQIWSDGEDDAGTLAITHPDPHHEKVTRLRRQVQNEKEPKSTEKRPEYLRMYATSPLKCTANFVHLQRRLLFDHLEQPAQTFEGTRVSLSKVLRSGRTLAQRELRFQPGQFEPLESSDEASEDELNEATKELASHYWVVLLEDVPVPHVNLRTYGITTDPMFRVAEIHETDLLQEIIQDGAPKDVPDDIVGVIASYARFGDAIVEMQDSRGKMRKYRPRTKKYFTVVMDVTELERRLARYSFESHVAGLKALHELAKGTVWATEEALFNSHRKSAKNAVPFETVPLPKVPTAHFSRGLPKSFVSVSDETLDSIPIPAYYKKKRVEGGYSYSYAMRQLGPRRKWQMDLLKGVKIPGLRGLIWLSRMTSSEWSLFDNADRTKDALPNMDSVLTRHMSPAHRLTEERWRIPQRPELDRMFQATRDKLDLKLRPSTDLYAYQRDNVLFMQHVESMAIGDPENLKLSDDQFGLAVGTAFAEWQHRGTVRRYDFANDRAAETVACPFITCPVTDYVFIRPSAKEVKAMRKNIRRGPVMTFKGGLLCDDVGLGKTLSVGALIMANRAKLPVKQRAKVANKKRRTHSVRTGEPANVHRVVLQKGKVKSCATLVVVPNHLAAQWQNELQKHIPLHKSRIIVISTKPQHMKYSAQDMIDAEVVIVTTNFLGGLYYRKTFGDYEVEPTRESPVTEQSASSVVDSFLRKKGPGLSLFHWHRIVVDEGHEVFNMPLSVNKSDNKAHLYVTCRRVCQYGSTYRWILSATPVPTKETHLWRRYLEFLDVRLHGRPLHEWWSPFPTSLEHEDTGYRRRGLRSEQPWSPWSICNKHIFKESYHDSYRRYASSLQKSPLRIFVSRLFARHLMRRNTSGSIGHESDIPETQEQVVRVDLSAQEQALHDTMDGKSSKLRLCCSASLLNEYTLNDDYIFNQIRMIARDRLDRLFLRAVPVSTVLNQRIVGLRDTVHSMRRCLPNVIKRSKEELMRHRRRIAVLEKRKKTSELSKVDEATLLHYREFFARELCTVPEYRKAIKENEKRLETLQAVQCENQNTDDLSLETIGSNLEDPHCWSSIRELWGSKFAYVLRVINQLMSDPANRVIVFSSQTRILLSMNKLLEHFGIRTVTVRGNVHTRSKALRAFSQEFVPGDSANAGLARVMLMSLESSASGTNLFQSTHIILMDAMDASREQIRAQEAQAIGRGRRQGMKHALTVVRFVCNKSAEEEIWKLIQKEEEQAGGRDAWLSQALNSRAAKERARSFYDEVHDLGFETGSMADLVPVDNDSNPASFVRRVDSLCPPIPFGFPDLSFGSSDSDGDDSDY
ncbi:MAG: hypothetical protein MHM6MM_003142 [Cercozoa sp. M6MM]